MWFAMVGLNYRTAPIEVRESLAFDTAELQSALELLTAKDDAREAVILSTCNRVEIYAVLCRTNRHLLRDFLRDFHKFSHPIDHYLYHFENRKAVKHLCRVATGIDSMVIGEPQVFGQVKDAFRLATEYGGAGRAMGQLFPQVFTIVKKARSRSGIGAGHVSVAYAAVDNARKLFGDLEGRCVMVIGAGKMGEVTTRDLRGCGVTDILVVNRTFSTAVDVAERVGGTPIMFHELDEYLPRCDILIGSLAAGCPLITPDHFRRAQQRRDHRPLLAIDIALPRCIDPAANTIEGVRLLNIDDLRHTAVLGGHERQQAIHKAEAIIESKADAVVEKLQTADILPTLSSIRREAEQIRRHNLDKAIAGISLGETERQNIDTLTRVIVEKILLHSESKLREFAGTIRK